MKHILRHKVNPWQLILSSRGPRAVQEFQIKLPRFGDFKFCALKKTFEIYILKAYSIFFFDVSFNLSLNDYLWELNWLKVWSF